MISSFIHALSLSSSSSHPNNEIASSSLQQEPIHSNQNALQQVIEEMNRRSTNLAYGLGIGLGRVIGTRDDSTNIVQNQPTLTHKAIKELKTTDSSTETVPFSHYYPNLFPQGNLRVLYLELDPGVDDGAALLQLLAARNSLTDQKKVKIEGIVPCVGNAILPQTEQNTLQFLELTENSDIPVYPGAIAPLAIENNQAAINAMNQAINATHFYGHDGEEDVGGWPTVNIPLQKTPGYQFAAARISEASPSDPLTLVSTSALTELSKTLTELERLDLEKGLPAGSFAQNINAISIMGGCLNPAVGCNAPFDVPDNEKTSEANFYFDPLAAQHVFATCQRYGIPILLAPLDLTQERELLWTQEQVKALQQIDNPVAQQMARVTKVTPYLDAPPCFPNGTYPMHDLQAATCLLFPDFYNVTRMAATIGDIGQIIVNPNATNAERNVYVLGMPAENQALFYQTVLSEYHRFDCVGTTKCQSVSNQSTITKIAALISIGVASVAAGALSTFGMYRWYKRRSQLTNEKQGLLSSSSKAVNYV